MPLIPLLSNTYDKVQEYLPGHAQLGPSQQSWMPTGTTGSAADPPVRTDCSEVGWPSLFAWDWGISQDTKRSVLKQGKSQTNQEDFIIQCPPKIFHGGGDQYRAVHVSPGILKGWGNQYLRISEHTHILRRSFWGSSDVMTSLKDVSPNSPRKMA